MKNVSVRSNSKNCKHRVSTRRFLVALTLCLGWAALSAGAQTGGQGALEGTVTDKTGAVVPNATVTAIDQASGVSSTRQTSSAGLYEITPLIPGIYTVTVKARGFEVLIQQNIEVNGMTVTGYSPVLAVGTATETVTVSTAPPQLQTTNATLGGVITNQTYESLPNLMNGQQRDPTAFGTLLPGAQAGARVPVMSGTGNYLAEVYLDGIPTTVSNMQGDNRPVANAVPVEAVDQMQVISNGPTAEYQGAGAMSFTLKSGGNQYHGTIADFARNTLFDTWGYTAPWLMQKAIVNGVPTTVPAGKPVEHQNELSASVGGPIKYTRHKGFFFFNWDQYHGRSGVEPSLYTIPTTLMRQGNFSELGTRQYLYDPLTNSCSGSTCTRQPFTGNIIPTGYISPISQYEEKFLPNPSLPGISNNYLAGGISGYDNHELDFKIDYDLSPAQRLSFLFTHGVRTSVGYGAVLPVPYPSSHGSIIRPTNMIIEHQYIFSPRMVNQFKYGFTRFSGPVTVPTEGVSPYRGGPDVGIGGLPAGQASENFPGSSFSTTTAFPSVPYQWANINAYQTVPNSFTIVDNLQWTKGRHNLTFGIQTQWLEDNDSGDLTASGPYLQSFSGASTANYVGTSINTTSSGFSYADFLLGAVNSGSMPLPYYSDIGGRFHPVSPYAQDDWKISPSLTLNLGLRWDYLPPYREVDDRWSFLNPTAINPLTGTAGELEYAGFRGSAISCQCRTRANTYWKNWGPRLGFAWSANSKTVVRAGFSMAYSRAGGVGGRAGDATGTGQTGFGSNLIVPPAISNGVDAGPSYYLNQSAAFQTAGTANTNFGGPGFTIPAETGASAAGLLLNIGNYVNSSGSYVNPGGAPGYVDPYLSGRAPEFEFFNFGIQRALTQNLTLMANYAGSESHFVAGAGEPGYWSGQINPQYLSVLGSVLATDNATNIMNAQATPANIAIAESADPSVSVPAFFADAGAVSAKATIGRTLQPYPQYSSPPGVQWDNIANISYNSLQITLNQRRWNGLSYTLNYTYSRDIGDDGTTRSAFPVPAGASSNGQPLPGNNRADRDLTTIDTPQSLNIYGLYELPFGRGHWGSDNLLMRSIFGGWSASGIFSYVAGTPLLITASGCTAPSQGTCMPDLVPGMKTKVRQNGSWGKGVTGANLAAVKYLNSAAFTLPNTFPLPAGASSKAVPITKIGDAPRTELAKYGLRNPSAYNLNASVRRSFNLTKERVKFIFQADCTNVTNKVTFGGINATWSASSSSTFGEVTSANGNRDFQFSGRITF